MQFPPNAVTEATVTVENDPNCEVTGRILEVLHAARDTYADGNRSEGWWDGAIDYIEHGMYIPNDDGSNPWKVER